MTRLEVRPPTTVIQLGVVDLVPTGPSMRDGWVLECRQCTWSSSAADLIEAVQWAGGHDATHHRWQQRWDRMRSKMPYGKGRR